MTHAEFAARQALATSEVATMQSRAKPGDAWLAERAETLYRAYERAANLADAELGPDPLGDWHGRNE